jgi:arylsulfatase A
MLGAAQARPKNVVVMLVDDLGQTDLSCYGSKFYETPAIDALAASGMKFTQASSACTVCSPTRASLLTGKYPSRLHITDWIPGEGRKFTELLPPENWTQELPKSEVTIAELFKQAGYHNASIGKWHLGEADNWPEQHGFDINVGGTSRGQPPSYFSPYQIKTLPDGPFGEYLTDREANEVCGFIEKHQKEPFFIYVPHYAVHTPIKGKEAPTKKYEAKKAANQDYPQKNAVYAAVVEAVNDSVATIRAKLESLKLWEDTVFVFTADNGGLLPVTSNLGLRAGKGSAYEGGTRIPLIIHWPGVAKPGSTCDTPVITPDVFATLTKAFELKDTDTKRDGRDLMPLLTQTGQLVHDRLYWHYPHYHIGGATPYSTVRAGDKKLIHFFAKEGPGRDELYDLANDPTEQKDLAAEQPEETKRLRGLLEEHWKNVDAQLPRVNPNADPEKEAKARNKGKGGH